MIAATDSGFWVILTLLISAGIWFGYTMASMVLQRRRGDRRSAKKALPNAPSNLAIRQVETFTRDSTVRGFDSPELFREDSMIRIQQLQKDILALRKDD
jgi:hypothetical protein